MRVHPHWNLESHTSFKYPHDGLLQLQDVVKEDELRHPTELDKNSEECIIVVKNGNTIGRATGIESFVREYSEHGIRATSMAVAIYPHSQKDGAFSAPGDSGSVIADANGRIVGILQVTGGACKTDSSNSDVSYATPYYWVEERTSTRSRLRS